MAKKKTAESAKSYNATVKGIIGVMATLMIVIIILLFTARGMFVLDTTKTEIATGKVTSTEATVYVPPESTTDDTDGAQTTTRKKTTTSATTTALPDGATEMRCSSAVYLHPSPSSDSENLLVIPQGAVVTVYSDTYGWYYLDYNGQKGYAYSSYFASNE